MAEQPTFESVNGVYRITEEQKPQLKEFFINEMEKHPKTAKGWLSKSKVNTKTIITDSKGNDLYEAFFKGNQDKWKFNKLETQIKSSNKRKVNEAAIDTKKAKAWKKKNITDWNLKDNPTGKPITASHPEFRRFEHRIKVSDNFWKSNDALDLGFKAGDVENLTYTNPAQWKLKDAGEMRYGQYFNFDVDDFGQVTYTPRSKFHPFELNDTKAYTGKIPLKELAEEAGHAYQRFGINPKRALFANAALAAANQRSIKAGTNMLVEGPNKENIKEFGLGIRDDLIHTGVVKALGAVTGAKALSIGGTTAAVPLGVGLVGGMTLNAVVEGATGKNLKEIGEQAEEAKLYRGYYGLNNGKSSRQKSRHTTSPKVNTEMLEEWDAEIRSGWYEDSLEDRQLNSSRYTKRLLKAI